MGFTTLNQPPITRRKQAVRFDSILNSGIQFEENEELLRFRIRLFNGALLATIFACVLFTALDIASINHLGSLQLYMTEALPIFSAGLMLMQRGHKSRFYPLSCIFLALSMAAFLSAFILVPSDELRIIWFYLQLWVVYVLLGLRAGVSMTFVIMLCVVIVNPLIAKPFSGNAMTTMLISMGATSLFSYLYTSQTVSYFEQIAKANMRLRQLASTDTLTGILNPRAFYDAANRIISVARRTNATFSVLFIDIDYFKQINDRFGHDTGDAVLRTVANCLSRQIRISDLLGRIGGEEFGVFLPDTNGDGAIQLAEKLRIAIQTLKNDIVDTERIQVTASFGVACSQDSDKSVADILRRADAAMYQAKEMGRNRIIVAPHMQESATVSFRVMNDKR